MGTGSAVRMSQLKLAVRRNFMSPMAPQASVGDKVRTTARCYHFATGITRLELLPW